jgi:hypothetical protein
MKQAVVCLAVLGLALLGPVGRASAKIGTLDAVPAATLLLPYFEVDFNDPAGVSTVFTVNNASATAVLAHVTLWSDLGVPTLGLNVYLTGYDAQVIDLRAIFAAGVLPRSASDGQDPADDISPQGPFSQDINFASCTGQLPLAPLSGASLTNLRNAHTGQAAEGGLCYGRNLGDGLARGYVTVDTVNNCTLRNPPDAGYFAAGGTGDATSQNVLWGDWTLLEAGGARGVSEQLVHIEADALDERTTVPGNYTFYGRFVAQTAIDNREPLNQISAASYASQRTQIIAWRDNGGDATPFACAPFPNAGVAWYPLSQQQIVVFSSQEDIAVPPPPGPLPPPPPTTLLPFPASTQRTRVGSEALPTPFKTGWLFLNLDTIIAGSPPFDSGVGSQSYVVVLHDTDAGGVLGRGLQGHALANASAPAPSDLPTGF